MTLYEFLVPILLAVPVLAGILWLRRSEKQLDDERSGHHPAE